MTTRRAPKRRSELALNQHLNHRVDNGSSPMSHAGGHEQAAGRICPIDYTLRAQDFASLAPESADVLYLAGGLYGNPLALACIEQMLADEQASSKALCLNGDFHWFDADASLFAQIEAGSRRHRRTRGNVETEISRGGDTEAGCGCAYPDSVGDADVQRSNSIMRQLAAVAREAVSEQQVQALGQLPAMARFDVGGLRIGVTHGDDRSLAGWSFAQDQLSSTLAGGLADRMAQMNLDVFASSHTCLPVAATHEPARQRVAIINNGSAGMANFADSSFGLITRIAVRDHARAPVPSLYECTMGDVLISAVPVHFEMAPWLAIFENIWPVGTAARESYLERICHGPRYRQAQAVHGRFALSPFLKDAA